MKVSKLLTLLCLLCNFSLYASESHSLEDYLSKYKKEQFKYDYKKNEEESAKLHDSWIAPIELSTSYVKSNPYKNEQTNKSAAIKINQPIFQSGGIYYGVKFATASKKYNDYSIDVAKRKMIKDTISILMQIKQSELGEKSQKLQIKNADIDMQQKQEQYLNGQLDSGFLDTAILQRNNIIEALYDIQTSKERLISKFRTLSDLAYNSVTIPHLELIDSGSFLQYNIELSKSRAEIEKNRYKKNITIAKYLPKINFTAGYNWQKSENQSFQIGNNIVDTSNELKYYDYGVRASIALDINSFRDIESAKIDYLKSEVSIKDTKRAQEALFEQVMQNIKNLDKKILLSYENQKIYKRLQVETQELYHAGYKTIYDVDTLKNSYNIQNIKTKIYELDKQLELLNLYEMYIDAK